MNVFLQQNISAPLFPLRRQQSRSEANNNQTSDDGDRVNFWTDASPGLPNPKSGKIKYFSLMPPRREREVGISLDGGRRSCERIVCTPKQLYFQTSLSDIAAAAAILTKVWRRKGEKKKAGININSYEDDEAIATFWNEKDASFPFPFTPFAIRA